MNSKSKKTKAKSKSSKSGNGHEDGRELIMDPRFAPVYSDPRFNKVQDPRFQKVPKKKSKVAIDSRFDRMFADKDFGGSFALSDKQGKPKKRPKGSDNPLRHYYRMDEDVQLEKIEEEIVKEVETETVSTKSCKRKFTMIDDDRDQLSEKEDKRAVLSIMKPSYVLSTGLNSKNLRSVNRKILCYLLRRLVRQHNWIDASGVLSVLLKVTCKEKSSVVNRLKYTVSMDLLKHAETRPRIKNIFDIWMKRIAPVKNSPWEDKCMVYLEFIIFCLTRGDIDDAHQAVMSLLQERQFGSHPMANMIVALTFYQRWLSNVPIEMRWKDVDESKSPTIYEFSVERSNHQAENSEACDSIYSNETDTHLIYDSETSVMNCKRISAANSCENEASFSQHDDSVNYASILPTLDGLDSWLLPIKLPNYMAEDYENFVRKHMKLLNDDYKNAIKYFRFALLSTPSVSIALLPLIQLLLIEGHINEAMNLLEKFCNNSETTLPFRLKATLVRHLDCNNYVTISTCFENILEKDPTCCHSMARLINMHQKWKL